MPLKNAPVGRFRQSKTSTLSDGGYVLALSIFTRSHPRTIVDDPELNFCVRDGNRWTLRPINTNFLRLSFVAHIVRRYGSASQACILKTEHSFRQIMFSKGL